MKPSSARSRGWLWALCLGLPLLAACVAYWLLPGWILSRVVAEAERRGVRLEQCRIDLGLRSVSLWHCSFSLLPAALERLPLSGATVTGVAERIEARITGAQVERVIVRRPSLQLSGGPRLIEMAGAGPTGDMPFPIDIEDGTADWRLDPAGEVNLKLLALTYLGDTKRLSASYGWQRSSFRGTLEWSPEGLDVAVGDASAPIARVALRFTPGSVVELRLELRRFPLGMLESSELPLTAVLRAIDVDGRVSLRVPLGLTSELPGGDLRLTLHGLQFPVPREVEGLIYEESPTVSGKIRLSRAFDRVTTEGLEFSTGELHMQGRGDATISLVGSDIDFRVQMSGPLSCRAIAQAAIRARAGSALGKVASRLARHAVTGNVQILAAISGNARRLPEARVVSSVGIGCGLAPLPVDTRLAREMLKDVSEHVARQLPQLPPLPKLDATGKLLPPASSSPSKPESDGAVRH